MSSVEMFFEEESVAEENRSVINIRKNLRDNSNPIEFDNRTFIQNFRLSKEAFQYLLLELDAKLATRSRQRAVSNIIKLAAVLRFCAQGSYQCSVGNDFYLGLAQPTVSVILKEVLDVMESVICPKWIKFQYTEEETSKAKINFYEKSSISNVIGCVDGTHIKIIAPKEPIRHHYYNREGFYSINVCDHLMNIRFISSKYPGASHDSAVWNRVSLKQKLEEDTRNGSKNSILEINGKNCDLLELVTKLESSLISSEVNDRLTATQLFSSTLSTLNLTKITDDNIYPVVEFYCARLKDHHSILPAVLDGIHVLIGLPILKDSSVQKLISSILQSISCQSQTRIEREKIYLILIKATEIHVKPLKSFGPDFIYGVINAIEGERDPRNLAMLFDFLPRFIKVFHLYHLSEEMFEFFAVYFPIDFYPTVNMKTSISRNELADKLAKCMVASSEFLEPAIDIALEKVGSDLIEAKLDSLDLLSLCAESFPAKNMFPHFEKVWSMLRDEIFPGNSNGKVLQAAERALRTILECASSDSEISRQYQAIVFGLISLHLNDIDHRLFVPARRISLICVFGDPIFGAEKVLQILHFKIVTDTINDDQQVKILEFMLDILITCQKKDKITELSNQIKQQIQEILLELLINKKNNSKMLHIVFDCISQIVNILYEGKRTILYEQLCTIIPECNKDSNLEKLIAELARQKPYELKEKCINKLLADFKDMSRKKQEDVYFFISPLIMFPIFEKDILGIIMKNVFDSPNSESQKMAIVALTKVMEFTSDRHRFENWDNEYQISAKLIAASKSVSHERDIILHEISTVLGILIQKVNMEQKKSILYDHLNIYEIKSVIDLFIISGIIVFVYKEIDLDNHFQNLLNDLTEIAMESEDKTMEILSSQLLCTFLNIVSENDINSRIIADFMYKTKLKILQSNEKAVKMFAWSLKGLLLRGYVEIKDHLIVLIDLLKHPTMSQVALSAFEILSNNGTKEKLPIRKALYEQKLFHLVLNLMWTELNAVSVNYVTAFLSILKMTPPRVLKINFSKVGPIIFKCLEVENDGAIHISLGVIEKFIINQDENMTNYLNYLISQFLKLSSYTNSMKIRLKAIECLRYVVEKYPIQPVISRRMDVILGLAPILDDKKRLVRNAAVKTRNTWCIAEIRKIN